MMPSNSHYVSSNAARRRFSARTAPVTTTGAFAVLVLLFLFESPRSRAYAFVPRTSPAQKAPVVVLPASRSSSSTRLFHNKASSKKRGSSSSGGGGFGQALRELRTASFPYSGTIKPGKQSPQRVVLDEHIVKPDYHLTGIPVSRKSSASAASSSLVLPWTIEVKSAKEIEMMRESGALAREILDLAGRAVRPGVTTDAIDALVHEATVSRGAYPSPLNYHGFPKSCCTSVNEVICHGIPDDRPLQRGDLLNIDITVYLNGYHGDCSEMFVVGGEDAVDDAGRHLLQATYDCWIAACQYVQPGRHYKDLGAIIEDYVTPLGLSTVRNFCGHGIGSTFHTNPNILHYRNSEPNGQMAVGHTFTIEPMICEGTARALTWPDNWTATTADGKRSAQFEHTLLITSDGVEALTGKTEASPLQFWERDSTLHRGAWLGTSTRAIQRMEQVNRVLLSDSDSDSDNN